MARPMLAWMTAVALCLPAVAQATLVSAGTGEYVNIRPCSPGTDPVTGMSSYCYFLGAPTLAAFGGLPEATTSGVSAGLAGIGSASAGVSLSGPAGAPLLGGEASTAAAAPGSTRWRTTSNSVAVQRYVYHGADTSRTFGGILTYSQSGTAPFPNGVGGGIYAALDVFTLPDAAVEVGTTADSNFFALLGMSGLPGYHSLDSDEYLATAPTTAGSATLSATVALHDGDAVWVWALLQTPAVNGGVIDASHTFASEWDNSTGLTPAAVATVPEPAGWALAVMGLFGVRLAVRRARAR